MRIHTNMSTYLITLNWPSQLPKRAKGGGYRSWSGLHIQSVPQLRYLGHCNSRIEPAAGDWPAEAFICGPPLPWPLEAAIYINRPPSSATASLRRERCTRWTARCSTFPLGQPELAGSFPSESCRPLLVLVPPE